MERGRIVEAGPHEVLLQRPKGLYAHLWRMQQGAQPGAPVGEPAGPTLDIDLSKGSSERAEDHP